jgi:tripartite motif-containing protein 71
MTESSVHQIQQRLTCPVCLDKFKQPKLLPCQHTFCLTPCLVNLVDRQTRRIKCPECRSIHMVPQNGVESFPTNITIMGFLDLDLSNVERNGVSTDKCSVCSQRRENLTKCVDCSKFYCSDCKLTHLAELKNETKQIVSNLRRTIPKLSEKVGNMSFLKAIEEDSKLYLIQILKGNFEQKQTIIKQNHESIKHDITSMVERLIDELRTRERCLHAEAEVYMESQLR